MTRNIFFMFTLMSAFIALGVIMGVNGDGELSAQEKEMKGGNSPYGPLSTWERHVIEEQGTDPLFRGEYTDHFERGLYACRRCGAPLYRSDDKFRSRCGWPAFDDEIPGQVRRLRDPDGRRMEIRCAKCDAHLGHVFDGERLTKKNLRHCVNSSSMKFEPQVSGRLRRAVMAGGCFWGVEEMMQRLPGVLIATSGYSGGSRSYPGYRDVSTGRTGHAESVELIYRSEVVSFETLAKYFFEIHDSTQKNGQGPDLGPQYRSVLFYLDDEQEKVGKNLIRTLKRNGFRVTTDLLEFEKFWNAEPGHQDYYEKKGTAPYCHSRRPIWDRLDATRKK